MVLFGGSWGATLALLYAEHYPKNVSGIILRGTFLARQQDLAWFINNGVNRIYPITGLSTYQSSMKVNKIIY